MRLQFRVLLFLWLLIGFGVVSPVFAKTAEDWYYEGMEFSNKGDFQNALSDFDHAISLNPEYPQAWQEKARSHFNLEQFEEALKVSNQTIRLSLNNSIAWRIKGNALFNLGRYDEALTSYNRTLELDPNDAEEWINKGTTLNRMQKNEDALIAFDDALAIDSNNSIAWGRKGAVLETLGRYEESLIATEKGISLDPNSTWMLGNKESTLIKLGRYDVNVWSEQIDSLIYLGYYDEALRTSDEAIARKPYSTSNWMQRVWILFNLGRITDIAFFISIFMSFCSYFFLVIHFFYFIIFCLFFLLLILVFFNQNTQKRYKTNTLNDRSVTDLSQTKTIDAGNLTTNILYDVFISYAYHDAQIAAQLCAELEKKKIKCWYADRDLIHSTITGEIISPAIFSSQNVLVIFSFYSNLSPIVSQELVIAVSSNKPIISFRIDDTPLSNSMEYLLTGSSWLSHTDNRIERETEEIIRIVKRSSGES